MAWVGGALDVADDDAPAGRDAPAVVLPMA